VFKVHVRQASIPLIMLPPVKVLGATDKQLQEARGLDLRETDAKHDTPAAFDKLHARFVRGSQPDADLETKRQELRQALVAMPLDPVVSRRLLELRQLGD
jgi:hypothetical protein